LPQSLTHNKQPKELLVLTHTNNSNHAAAYIINKDAARAHTRTHQSRDARRAREQRALAAASSRR
jgi:hypothetical protein